MDCRNDCRQRRSLRRIWAGSPTQDRGDYTEQRDNRNQARFPPSAITVTAEYPVCFEYRAAKAKRRGTRLQHSPARGDTVMRLRQS